MNNEQNNQQSNEQNQQPEQLSAQQPAPSVQPQHQDVGNEPVVTPQPPIIQAQNLQSNASTGEISAIQGVERVTAWIMVLSAIFFALISVLAIWHVFGDGGGEIVWRSLTTIGIIAFTALVINVGARMIEGRKK